MTSNARTPVIAFLRAKFATDKLTVHILTTRPTVVSHAISKQHHAPATVRYKKVFDPSKCDGDGKVGLLPIRFLGPPMC